MAALEEINYLLRPNKNIERKLIVTALAALTDEFAMSQYRYVGLASLWFLDFVLMYRTLGVRDMVAIERRHHARRVHYNRPLGCVRVVAGDSTAVLPSLRLARKRAVVWMDYEGGLGGEALKDAPILCEEVPSGSILIVTINAHPRTVKNAATLRELAGDLVPAELPADYFDREAFPRNVAAILLNALDHATRKSGRVERLLPLFNFSYKDGAPMVTVGGMVANERDAARLGRCGRLAALRYVRPDRQFTVAAPPLTVREKLALDQLLPSAHGPTVETVRRLGFDLKKDQIEAYREFWGHYPLFGELQS